MPPQSAVPSCPVLPSPPPTQRTCTYTHAHTHTHTPLSGSVLLTRTCTNIYVKIRVILTEMLMTILFICPVWHSVGQIFLFGRSSSHTRIVPLEKRNNQLETHLINASSLLCFLQSLEGEAETKRTRYFWGFVMARWSPQDTVVIWMLFHLVWYNEYLKLESSQRIQYSWEPNQKSYWRVITFSSWVRKILWRRKWQPTPVSLHGKSPGQRSLVGYSPWYCKKSDMAKLPSVHTCPECEHRLWAVCYQ